MQFLKTIKAITLSLAGLVWISDATNAMQLLGKIPSHHHSRSMIGASPHTQRQFCSPVTTQIKQIPATQQGYVSAKTKLHLVQDIIKQYPNLTINTQIPSADNLWLLYEQDKNFIEKSIERRSNKEKIQKSIKHIHNRALEAGWNSKMSISDFNLIAQFWVSLLSSSSESQVHALYDLKRKKNIFWNANFTTRSELTNYLYTALIDMDFNYYLKSNDIITKPWQRSHGFMIPHISPKGSVPLPVMQEAWGFFTEEGTNKASYIDFLAVPTNPVVNFDYVIDFPPYDAWQHDLAHAKDNRSGKREQILNLAQKTGNLLSAIHNATLSYSENQSINIAFFHVFHEPGSPIRNLKDRIDVLESKNETKLKSQIIPSIYFESIEQYRLYVESTERMLGRKLDGDTLIDKYRSYINITLEGLRLLKEFSPHYDESFPM